MSGSSSRAGKGEIYVCQICQKTFEDRLKSCHPLYTILCEGAVVRDELGRVVDCTQAFRAAKVST